MDIPIPANKAELFKVLILKDYHSNEDQNKNKMNFDHGMID